MVHRLAAGDGTDWRGGSSCRRATRSLVVIQDGRLTSVCFPAIVTAVGADSGPLTGVTGVTGHYFRACLRPNN
eukprot:scaffold3887_cov33-Phaeocystis_antarctica.AAC.2